MAVIFLGISILTATSNSDYYVIIIGIVLTIISSLFWLNLYSGNSKKAEKYRNTLIKTTGVILISVAIATAFVFYRLSTWTW